MSLLSRAKLAARIHHFLLHSVTPLQQSNLYSTKIDHTVEKSQQLTNPRAQKSPEASSSSNFSDGIMKQTGEQIVRPKPSKIPYQAKVANCVNLIGYVKTPVHFEAASDGKHFAATVISQEINGEKDSLLIPVVFEGDLAHVVAYHVKENNRVLVSGQLSTDPLRFALSDSLVNFHVVAENLNFVEGFKRNFSRKKFQVSFSGVEIDKHGNEKIENAIKMVDNDDEEFTQQWKEALEDAKVKRWAENLKLVESKNRILDLWRDLVRNSLLWWDYRDHKSRGLVKEKFPDFTHKVTGDGLWINTAPDWVLSAIGKLEFDVKVIEAKQGLGERKNDDKGEDSWNNLVGSPKKWWDNRLDKRFPNSPDFRHKETGEGLWVSNAPAWALSKLPPLKDDQNSKQS